MKRGFTLIEMMIVTAIVGILLAIAIPPLATLFGMKSHKTVTCYSGEKIIYEGPGAAFTESNGCTVMANGDRYRCTACAERRN